MDKVEGYVFIVNLVDGIKVIYGEGISKSDGCEDFQANGLSPYLSIEFARQEKKDFFQGKKGIERISLVRVKMRIANNFDEAQKIFRFGNPNLVGVIEPEKDYFFSKILFGPYVMGGDLSLNGDASYLYHNNLKTFNNFFFAKAIAREVRREKPDKRIRIAEFILEEIF